MMLGPRVLFSACLVVTLLAACGGISPIPATDGGIEASAADAATDVGAKDSAATDGAAACATQPTAETCVQCCRSPQPPNYGGFELYGYEACQACPLCTGLSPCATNVTPPATSGCLKCLQAKIAKDGLPLQCKGAPECAAFASCLVTCPAP